MRLTAVEIGIFEDYEDEEVLEVGIAGVDEAGSVRSFSIQRSTCEPDEQDIRGGMDSYNISTERGLTVYGCLRRVQLADAMLAMHFAVEDAEILEISSSIEIDLGGLEIDIALLSRMLRMILSWGSLEKQPQLIGI